MNNSNQIYYKGQNITNMYIYINYIKYKILGYEDKKVLLSHELKYEMFTTDTILYKMPLNLFYEVVQKDLNFNRRLKLLNFFKNEKKG